jgi:cobyrinic acid a,c-diamide synthase
MRAADVGIVEGRFSHSEPADGPRGGRLDDLCEVLALPEIVVVDAAQIKRCLLPQLPSRADAVLLDCVNENDYARMQTCLEALWGVPVLGGLGELPGARAIVEHLPAGSRPSRELCRRLGDELSRHLQLGRLLALSECDDLPAYRPQLFCCPEVVRGLNIAVAYDEAFHCYCPDALDLLELHGARVRDFSPLRDERLPPDVDLVYLGCGYPENFAGELASNHCMKLALNRHFCRGRRIYAEGGGAAYLCRQVVLPDGRRLPMVGLLPAVAWQDPNPGPVRPAELTLSRDHWLGESTRRVRGYLNARWVLQRTGPVAGAAPRSAHRDDLLACHHAIGSRLHMSLVAQPRLVRSFLRPCSCHLVPA